MRLDVLYRGPLMSCNYACGYCPFAKRNDNAAALARDRAALSRFLSWIEAIDDFQLGVMVAPWGEALVRPWYRMALVALSRMPQVRRASAQTNGHWPLDWLDHADLDRLALWVTYHPTETTHEAFLARCRALTARGVRYSVGMVAVPGVRDEAQRLREALPDGVYLWLNPYKDGGFGYDESVARALAAIDPLFPRARGHHPSRGHACDAGHTAIAVDGDGVVRRCHFVHEPIGHIDGAWREGLRPRLCPRRSCDCHLGYVRLKYLGFAQTFGEGILERIPSAAD